jgi:hypothetical protein
MAPIASSSFHPFPLPTLHEPGREGSNTGIGRIDLALACCALEPGDRPIMPLVLQKLQEIEREVMSRGDE